MNVGVFFEVMFLFFSLVGVCIFFFKKIVIIFKKNVLKILEVKVLLDNLYYVVKIVINLFFLDK